MRWTQDARLAIHAALTAVMAWLGMVLGLPGSTFATSRTFSVMERIGTEEAWALAFWSCALVGGMGLTSRSRGGRLMSVLVLATSHGLVALCLFLANPLTTATGTYVVLAGLGYYLAWRRTREGI